MDAGAELVASAGGTPIVVTRDRQPAALVDVRTIAAFDHAGARLDDLHSVVLHVVIRLKIGANLDAPGAST
jgi:hypothetical protein